MTTSQPIEPRPLALPAQDADVVGQPLAQPELVTVPARLACPDIFVSMSRDQKPSTHPVLTPPKFSLPSNAEQWTMGT